MKLVYKLDSLGHEARAVCTHLTWLELASPQEKKKQLRFRVLSNAMYVAVIA